MDNIFVTVCFLISLLNAPIESITIDCAYHSGDFSHSLKGPSNYWCRVANMNLISRQDLIVQNITGTHLSNKIDDNVRAFQVYTGTNYYGLKGVERFFKNLLAVTYQSCQLKEIHKEDLKPFPKIIDLYLNGNDLEVIEEGLLDYNPELVFVYLINNKITQIHPNVFDKLNKITHLYISSNTCASKDATDAAATKALIQQIRTDNLCQNVEFMNFDSKLKILENNLKPMNVTTFKEQLDGLKTELKYSKYSKYSPFDDRLETLKTATYAEYCQHLNQTDLIDELPQNDNKPFRLEDMSHYDYKAKTMDENLNDFQNKIAALSSKVTSIAKIVEQLEDKLSKIFKSINLKVTVDV
ncbi:uncharacterized protein [Chironomus tepperi]|uniref:uncharacterized protein n=1 Tax=Chironomus tepperi TaxID=113505 RepID=UPI00391FB13C